MPRALSAPAPAFVERAENAEFWDSQGRRWIDFASGTASLNTGHRHPRVMAAAAAQMERFTHVVSYALPFEPLVALAERLNALSPCGAPSRAAFFTTGAEALENAVKIARAATGRPAVVAFEGGFHGRTALALAMTGRVDPCKAGLGPMAPEVFHAPFPDARRGVSAEGALAAIETLFAASVDPARVAALVYEPVQGEGGARPAPPGFPEALRALCDRHGILLVADEVQTGFGRTGAMFACEHYDAPPDLVALGKALGGGFALSAVVGRAEAMDAPAPGALGGTFGGAPVAVAAAGAALDVIEDEGLVERARRLGAAARRRLEGASGAVEVRGLGLLLAVEARGALPPLLAAARRRGLHLAPCGPPGTASVRVAPALTIPEAVLEEGLGLLEEALAAPCGGA